MRGEGKMAVVCVNTVAFQLVDTKGANCGFIGAFMFQGCCCDVLFRGSFMIVRC